MDVCVENEVLSLVEPMQESQEEEKGRGADTPRYTGEVQETVAQGLPAGQAGAGPAGSSDVASPRAPQAEPSAEKSPWLAWTWLGWCKSPAPKIPNIVHVDVDAFFASVEQVLNPRLRGKPVLVGRGCVASASYEAKAQGVRTAMGFREALRVCPKAIVVPGQYEHYADFAERVRRILETYTPAVEIAALDDFYLDFAGTERLYPDYRGTLVRLQMEVFKETGLSVSLGAARTKVVASVASRLERPRGFRMVAPGEEEAFLTPLPVEKLHGIGHVHTDTLAERGIATIGQLRRVPSASKSGSAPADSTAARCSCLPRRSPSPAKPPLKAAPLIRSFSPA